MRAHSTRGKHAYSAYKTQLYTYLSADKAVKYLADLCKLLSVIVLIEKWQQTYTNARMHACTRTHFSVWWCRAALSRWGSTAKVWRTTLHCHCQYTGVVSLSRWQYSCLDLLTRVKEQQPGKKDYYPQLLGTSTLSSPDVFVDHVTLGKADDIKSMLLVLLSSQSSRHQCSHRWHHLTCHLQHILTLVFRQRKMYRLVLIQIF